MRRAKWQPTGLAKVGQVQATSHRSAQRVTRHKAAMRRAKRQPKGLAKARPELGRKPPLGTARDAPKGGHAPRQAAAHR